MINKLIIIGLRRIAPNRSLKFLARQAKAVEEYGQKEFFSVGVGEKEIEELTPFRRLSKKPCSLPDKEYYIEQFEKDNKNILPANWEKLSDEEKIDFIVKERYQKRVANKIMNNLKDCNVEHAYTLDSNGDIVTHDIGNEHSVMCSSTGAYINKMGKGKFSTHIHNHPGTFFKDAELEKYIQQYHPEYVDSHPFSGEDIYSSIFENIRNSFVIDRQGHKFFYKKCDRASERNGALAMIKINQKVLALIKSVGIYDSTPKKNKYYEYIKTPNYDKDIAEKMRLDYLEEIYQKLLNADISSKRIQLFEKGFGLVGGEFKQLN